jgi:hypothetical protein
MESKAAEKKIPPTVIVLTTVNANSKTCNQIRCRGIGGGGGRTSTDGYSYTSRLPQYGPGEYGLDIFS